MHKYSIAFYRFHIENRDRSFFLPARVTSQRPRRQPGLQPRSLCFTPTTA